MTASGSTFAKSLNTKPNAALSLEHQQLYSTSHLMMLIEVNLQLFIFIVPVDTQVSKKL